MYPTQFSQSMNSGGEHFYPDKAAFLIFSSYYICMLLSRPNRRFSVKNVHEPGVVRSGAVKERMHISSLLFSASASPPILTANSRALRCEAAGLQLKCSPDLTSSCTWHMVCVVRCVCFQLPPSCTRAPSIRARMRDGAGLPGLLHRTYL